MKDKLIQWAQTGDGDCMYKLCKIYQAEGKEKDYVEWLSKSAEAKTFDAMTEYAAHLREGGNYEKALAIYKELAETFYDEVAMERVVDMCTQSQGVAQNDKDTLNFILKLINRRYNEIYQINRGNIVARTLELMTRRHDECTWETLQAIERRRIAARIRKILAQNEGSN